MALSTGTILAPREYMHYMISCQGTPGQWATAGRRLNAHVWERDYDKARVVMNLPDATEPYQVTLDKPARDSFTGETGTKFTVPPGEGRVLVWE